METENAASPENNEGHEQKEAEGKSKRQLPADMYYEYEELHSRPSITPNSEIPEDLLHFFHSFGYDSERRANLQVLDDNTLIFIAGNLLVLLDISTKEQRYLRSCSGGGIGCITVHPSREYFAAGEKGNQPHIVIYEYPSLRPYRILRRGTERAYSFLDFDHDGSLLASVGNTPDYMLYLWDWRQEEVILSCKAISQEVYRVTFSPYDPGLLTSSGSVHIKFWKIADTFTGPKLQGVMGRFRSTPPTDIEGCMELPDGKVVSGTGWGNLLLWDRRDITMEICRKDGQTCHVGTVQPFALEDGQLLTIGSDGILRSWDYERLTGPDSNSNDSSTFGMEPLHELVVGHNVCLSSIVKSSLPDSFIWFAQDSNGAIWKLDLSFTNTTLDPECLFSFHAGPIQALDVSKKSHLMATTTLDRSVKVFDFLEKREITTIRYNQSGTTLSWAPLSVNQSACLLVIGFEDGVVRLLELYNPQKLHVVTGCRPTEDAKLCLKQAFKPHNAAVTAVAYERNGEILATGVLGGAGASVRASIRKLMTPQEGASADHTVFFFTVGEKYNPIGYIHVPGAVQMLEWSPHSHHENRLLILCQSGHVVEVHCPDPEAQQPAKTFQLFELSRRSFRFRSIKSQIKREQENARLQAMKEKKKKEREEQIKESQLLDAEQEEEEEEKELPPIYIPETPSPLYCGFYSQPGQFWLSMGGFDSGFLYHCKFSEQQDKDPEKRQDEPFDFLPVHNAENDPIHAITFSSNRQLLLCGMHSGSVRAYLLQPGDLSITSMQAYWTLSIHDNEYGHLRHIRCSHDDHFVLTAGDDGNIFSFSLLPPEEIEKSLQRKRAKVPSPRVGLENEPLAHDIEDPAAYSIETAKQKLQQDHLRQKAKLKEQVKQNKLAALQKKYEQVLKVNQSLPEHARLKPEELQLDPRFYEQIERVKAEQVMEVRKQLAWEQERCNIAFNKLHDWFMDSPEANVVTVVAMRTDCRVSTYHLPVLTKPSNQESTLSSPDGDRDATPEDTESRAESAEDSCKTEEEEEVLRPPDARPKMKLGDREEERLRKAVERAEQTRIKIQKKKKEWDQLYAEKPDENYEDPRDVQAICEARENIGSLQLKSDDTEPINLQETDKKKREELLVLQEIVREKQIEMNGRIVALRDSKVRQLSWLHSQTEQLQKAQERQAPHLHLPPLTLPTILPEETPEKWLQYKLTALERYRVLREQRYKALEQQDACWSSCNVASLLDQMKKDMEEEQGRKEEETPSLCASSVTIEEEKEEETAEGERAELSELEEEVQKEEEIRFLYERDCLLKKIESSTKQFDAELWLLIQQKQRLDSKLKLAYLHQLTLLQEMLLLRQFEMREGILQENLNQCIKEENSITSKVENLKKQLELKQREIAKLQEKNTAVFAAFQDSLGEHKEFEVFLTKVFKKKIKRVKKEQKGNEEGESDEDSDDDDDDCDSDDDYSSTEEGGVALDDTVCPSGCQPELFEYTLKLRERRLDLNELLAEEKKSAEALEIECDLLVKKEKPVKSRRKAAEDDLDQVNIEIQQKMRDLDVVVPLRLHQIQFLTNDSLPSDLSGALVVDSTLLNKLQEHIQQLKVENVHQKELYIEAQLQRTRLDRGLRDMAAEIKELEEHCNELMMTKFGKLVDLDAVQTQSGSRRLEELKQEQVLKRAAYATEIKQWDAKVDEASDHLSEVTKRNTDFLRKMMSLTQEKIELERKLLANQGKMAKQQYQGYDRSETQEAIRSLEDLVKRQSQQAKGLRREIDLLLSKGAHVTPPGQVPFPTPTGKIHTGKKGHVLLPSQNQPLQITSLSTESIKDKVKTTENTKLSQQKRS